MISFANSSMLPKLKLIWSESFFDDTSSIIEFFYSHFFCTEKALVYLEDGEPASMLHFFTAELMLDGIYRPVGYVYAVATAPQHRGKRLFAQLLYFAKKCFVENNVETMILAPAEDGLFRLYAKYGYTTAFKVKVVELEPIMQEKGEVTSSSILPREYKFLRDAFFDGEGYVRWGIEFLSYMIAENAEDGGFTVKITIDDKEYAVLGIANGDILNIRETTLTDEHMLIALSHLALQNGCKKIVAVLPVSSTLKGTIKNIGMSDTPMQNTSGYMNIT